MNLEVAIVYIEFDLDEGPQFRYLIPKTFPVDYQQEFQISNYALYSEGIFQFETENFSVFGYSFRKKIEHERTDYTKAAITILIRKSKKVNIEIIVNFVENKIIPIAKKIIRGEIEINEENLREILESFKEYLVDSKKFKKFDKVEESGAKNLRKKFMDKEIAKNNMVIIVDSVASKIYLITPKSNIKDIYEVDAFSEVNSFVFTPLSRFLVFSNSEKVLRKALQILSTLEKRNTMITVSIIKEIIKD